MFDRDGLLCPHILKVFTNRDVDAIPERYLLQRWSKEATTKVPEHLSGPEPTFGVPTTNKLRYNALCRKMTSLAAEACLGPEKYTIVSAGIDKLFETVRAARDSSAIQLEVEDGVAVNVTANQKPIAKVKNPPRTNSKGRPKEKVDRFKSIVMQAREKAMKKKGKPKSTAKKPCSYFYEVGHSVQACEYMAKAEALRAELRRTELKL
jgi:hypothetical protein